MYGSHRPKGSDMTRTSVHPQAWDTAFDDAAPIDFGAAAPRTPRRRALPRVVDGSRPGPHRPAPMTPRYSGTGVRVSRAVHTRRPAKQVTPVTVVGLALLAALITVWLGAVAQFGETVRDATAPVPDQLAVVQVKSGETLAHLAARVAPEAPVSSVVERIRELNELQSPVIDAGQTLIAPVG